MSDAAVPADVVVEVSDADRIVSARQAGHEMARDLGFSLADVTMIATAISEVAQNITSYAGRGLIRVGIRDREGRPGLLVLAEDEGPGIADVDRALEESFSTRRGLGLGLPGARRLMDGLIVDSVQGRGTTIEMWKWMPDGLRRSRELRTGRGDRQRDGSRGRPGHDDSSTDGCKCRSGGTQSRDFRRPEAADSPQGRTQCRMTSSASPMPRRCTTI